MRRSRWVAVGLVVVWLLAVDPLVAGRIGAQMGVTATFVPACRGIATTFLPARPVLAGDAVSAVQVDCAGNVPYRVRGGVLLPGAREDPAARSARPHAEAPSGTDGPVTVTVEF